MRSPLLMLLLLSSLFSASAAGAATSALWGQSGEKWTFTSPLPDFRKAGYQAGAAPIPQLPQQVSVKDFGARGDGTTDDSAAFAQALSAAHDGAVFIPAGRYLITHQLKITTSNIVLRGAGSSMTTLYFSEPLSQAVGPASTAPGGSWSWSGGFIYAKGQDQGTLITPVTAAASRGAVRITVASAADLVVGEMIRLVLTDSGGTLGRALLGNQASAPANMTGQVLVDFSAKIVSITGNQITLDRPLHTDVSLAWNPAIYSTRPSVHDVGVEDLTIQFPVTLYAGHFLEPGYNAIDFDGVSDGWIRRVNIVNADSGIFLRTGTRRCTVEQIHFSAASGRLRTGYGGTSTNTTTVVGGHHGILTDGLVQDNLITGFQFDFRFIHDLAVSAYSTGNVFSEGEGLDMNFDQHRRAPYENLYTNIDAGLGTRLWESGGDTSEGPPCGMYETFWNIRTRQTETSPTWALDSTLVGWTTTSTGLLAQDPNWLEAIVPTSLVPSDIYLAELTLSTPTPTATAPPPTVTIASPAAPAIRIYPDPWRADEHRDRPFITFDDLPAMSTIKIFTISGHLVKTLLASGSSVTWDLNTDNNQPAASGIYMYVLTASGGEKTRGKLALIR